MGDIFFYIAAFIFVIALIILGAWAWRMLIDNGVSLPGGAMLKGARDKRIGMVESVSIDGKHKLVLIRRDDVEHLIMTGGPVDMVIETGIQPAYQSAQQPAQTQGYVYDSNAPGTGAADERLFAGRVQNSETSYSSND